MPKNVIILTSGLTGSSVLTAFISQAGFWTGDRTHRKDEYDTYENQELVDLNIKLLSETGYKGNYMVEFPSETIERLSTLGGSIDQEIYRRFVDKCNQHSPWIWKDPRLWLTIRFWLPLLDPEQCQFIVLTRSLIQSWVSELLRRQIRTFRHCKDYEIRVKQSAMRFLEEHKLPYLHVRYEDLIKNPDGTAKEINRYLHTHLTVDDLRKIYRRPLYKSPRRSILDHVKAGLVYLKNYSQRIDVSPERRA